jgi:hypothetical protein
VHDIAKSAGIAEEVLSSPLTVDDDTLRALRIWWLDVEDRRAIGQPGVTWPAYLRSEFALMLRSSSRGRVRVPPEFGNVVVPDEVWGSPIGRRVGLCTGIVIHAEDVAFLVDLPGLVTDLRLRRV